MKNKEVFVPIEDVAEHFAVSVVTIRAWVRKGHISRDAFIKVGSTYRFRLSDVISSLLANGAKVDPTEDGPYTYVMRGSQQHAEESVASYMKKKEADTNSKKAITSAEVEELFDEDM